MTLHRQGVGRTAIARQLRIDKKTVGRIVAGQGAQPHKSRTDKIDVDGVLLEQLHRDCRGYVERMYEILTEEHGLSIGYSTLTRLVRVSGLGGPPKERSGHMPDIAGAEMQHDTSVHQIRIGGSKQKIISSGIYLRYSKMRYVKFYRRFNRFTMKCFIDEALRHWGYCARTCIIDNTNLAILLGSGSRATMNPEMVSFALNYGFSWKAHEIGHANRKAGTERNFYTVETNFLPGRTFSTLEDLNTQAIQWATVRFAKRPQAKTKLIPLVLFESEKSALVKLPDFVSAPYLPHQRCIDEYGYVSFDGNYYWVPQTAKASSVAVVQYADHLRIMQGCGELVRHVLAADGIKNEMIAPPGHTHVPRYTPKNRKQGCGEEEERLMQLGDPAGPYLVMLKSPDSGIRQYPAFIRGLYALSRQLGPTLFLAALQRAVDYKVYDLAIIRNIAHQIIQFKAGQQPQVHNAPDVLHDYRNRDAFRQGQFTNENDIDYQQPPP